ncbi:DNA-binding protein [Sphingomonas oryzagri]
MNVAQLLDAPSKLCAPWFRAAEIALLNLPDLPDTSRGIEELAEAEGWSQRTAQDGTPLARSKPGGSMEYHATLFPELTRKMILGKVLGAITDGWAEMTASQQEAHIVWVAEKASPELGSYLTIFTREWGLQ